MAARLYKSYLRLCEIWPIDTTKKGRDLGEFIRKNIAKEFSRGEASSIENIAECEKKLESLYRLANNTYGRVYKRPRDTASCEMNVDECRSVISTDFLNRLQQSKLPFKEKLRLFFQNKSQ